MKSARTFAAALAAVCLLLALPPAFAAVRTDYNHGVNFSRFHTYCWGKVHIANGLVAHRVRKAVNILLRQKGWKQTPHGQITVFALGHVINEKQAQTLYDGMGGGWGMGWGWGGWGWGPGGGFGESNTRYYRQPVGNLVIDLFRTKNKQLIWRGIASAPITGNSGRNRKVLYRNIHIMFGHFPPRTHH